jgi:hypothetical protein
MRYKNTYKHVWAATELLSRSENHPYSRPSRFMRYIRWCFSSNHSILCFLSPERWWRFSIKARITNVHRWWRSWGVAMDWDAIKC